MSFETRDAMAVDYQPVSYPGSPVRFRGPVGNLEEPHVLCLGGTETFGRFVPVPFPRFLANRIDTPVVNMGVAGGGIDVIMNDPAVASACRNAKEIVLQVQGAQNLSNRMYTVHPRRNDRFVRASGMLRTIFREVDFTEFHFNRHMLDHLRRLSEDRFSIIRDELREAWTARMLGFIQDVSAPVHLLWFSCRLPSTQDPQDGLGAEPLFVTSDMLDQVAEASASLTVICAPNVPSVKARSKDSYTKTAIESPAAQFVPGPEAHEQAASALVPLLLSA